MPHLLVDRARVDLFSFVMPTRKDISIGAVAIEALDTVAALCCLAGSVCFVPEWSADVTVFLRGCALFLCGSTLYVFASCLALANSWMEQGLESRECVQSAAYLVAASVYLVGAMLYWPSSWQTGSISPAKWLEIEHGKSVASQSCASWPQRANLRHLAFDGSILCVAGSLMLAAAAFANMMLQRTHNDYASKLLIAIASFYMLGSVLFAMSAVAFLPGSSCGAEMANIGAGLAVLGSGFYLAGAALSLARASTILNAPRDSFYGKAILERDPLVAYRSNTGSVVGEGSPLVSRSLPSGIGRPSGSHDLLGAYRSVVPASVGVPPPQAADCAP